MSRQIPNSSLCVICYQKMGDATILRCSHKFHKKCIDKWFEQKPTCPICRDVSTRTMSPPNRTDSKITLGGEYRLYAVEYGRYRFGGTWRSMMRVNDENFRSHIQKIVCKQFRTELGLFALFVVICQTVLLFAVLPS